MAVAKAYALEGATVFLSGRTLFEIEAVADDVVKEGRGAQAARVNALVDHTVEEHLNMLWAELRFGWIS